MGWGVLGFCGMLVLASTSFTCSLGILSERKAFELNGVFYLQCSDTIGALCDSKLVRINNAAKHMRSVHSSHKVVGNPCQSPLPC